MVHTLHTYTPPKQNNTIILSNLSKKNMKKKGERKRGQLSLFSMKYMMTSHSQDGDPKKEPKSFPTFHPFESNNTTTIDEVGRKGRRIYLKLTFLFQTD